MPQGRPRGDETRRRTDELLAHLAAGRPLVTALELARVKPERICRLLDDTAFRHAICGLMDAADAAPA